MDKDKGSERPDSKTYHIYGIGEIYDKEGQETCLVPMSLS